MSSLIMLLQIHNYIIGSLSVVLNTVLISSLIWFSDSEWHRHLRIFLGFTAVVDTIFSVVELLTQVAIVVSDGYDILFCTGVTGIFGESAATATLCIYSALVYLAVLTIPATCVYRTAVLESSSYRPLWTVLIILGTFVCVLPTTSILPFLRIPEEEKDKFLNRIDPEHKLDFHQYYYIGGKMTDLPLQIGVAFVGVEFVVAYASTITLLVRLNRYLTKHKEHLSTKTLKIQRRLTIALGLQAACPFVTCALPLLVYMGLLLARVSLPEELTIILGMGFSWIPLANAVIGLAFYTRARLTLRTLLSSFTSQSNLTQPSHGLSTYSSAVA